MDEAKRRRDSFITEESRFKQDLSFLLILREWNSYTPMIPGQEESDRGGGYFIRHGGEGIVIDPGYDFIENFHNAGGMLSDINHIIVTHAHDDHTAELEALIMLFHKRWNSNKVKIKKPLSLYVSAGAVRKFTGLLNYRDVKIKHIVTLYPPTEQGLEQRVRLNGNTVLTVLPAYHDDVITEDTAVGLGFELSTTDGTRTVVFTSDSGLYPPKRDARHQKIPTEDEDRKGEHKLDVGPGRALFERYPEIFKTPDLLVAHIGSIKRREFDKPLKRGDLFSSQAKNSSQDEGRWYYPNHLGLLGTLTMLDQCRAKAAIISEFGSELKGFHYELVKKLGETLHNIQKAERTISEPTFVIPGDLTTVYDIATGKFLCHETCEFEDPEELECREARDFIPQWDRDFDSYEPVKREENDANRTYLFKNNSDYASNSKNDLRSAQEYYRRFFNHELPYHAPKESDSNS